MFKKIVVLLILSLLTMIFVGCSSEGDNSSGSSSYTIQGQVTRAGDGQGLAGVTISFSGNFNSVVTDASGNWQKKGLSGEVEVTPVKADWNFTPAKQVVTEEVLDVNFEASPTGYTKTAEWSVGDPRGIVTDDNGNVYVVNYDNIRVDKFDSSGKLITSYAGMSGFPEPAGITVTPDYLYVTETVGDVIYRWDLNSNIVLAASFGGPGSADGLFNNPMDLTVSNQGNLYVADTGNHRIQTLDPDCNFIAKWGSYGTSNGQFASPSDLAFDTEGNVYVVDTENYRIQKFISDGTFVTTWGQLGTGPGEFGHPISIAVGPNNYIYVADDNKNCIMKFNSSGDFLMSWDGNGLFGSIYDLTVDVNGNVYVTDDGNDRVYKLVKDN